MKRSIWPMVIGIAALLAAAGSLPKLAPVVKDWMAAAPELFRQAAMAFGSRGPLDSFAAGLGLCLALSALLLVRVRRRRAGALGILLRKGRSPAEVARRTGLAQDAVRVLARTGRVQIP
ncbi:MAG: hypothetical protein AB7I33_12050 [Gemmatimonadales bacterium]